MRQNPRGKPTLFKPEEEGGVAKATSQSASHASDGLAPADRHGHEALLRLPTLIDLDHHGTFEVEKILAAFGELGSDLIAEIPALKGRAEMVGAVVDDPAYIGPMEDCQQNR